MAPASGAGAATSVQVAVRIRPTTTQDASSIPSRFQRTVIHALGSNAVSIDPVGPGAAAAAGQSGGAGGGTPMSPGPGSSSAAGSKKQTFAFDHVLSPSCTQHDVFVATAQPLISRFLDGFNCTMLAYGQTSSGKTFTMTGVDLDRDADDISNNMGIIPRSVATIFGRAQQLRDERAGAWSYTIKGSFLELYNEDLIDLLDDSPARRDVQIREDKDGHILLSGLREVPVRSPAEVMGLIRQGTAIRTTNATDMNAQSSRSHAIFSLTLTQRKFSGSGPPPRSSSPLPPGRSPSRLARPGSMLPASRMSMQASRPGTPSFQRTPGARPASSLGVHGADRGGEDQSGEGEWTTIVSKFHFVDLAGSERLKRTAAQGDRVKEGISINSGLLALGNVISALGDPARARSNTATHVPYRDSKLTRLLQDSLGGNAHTLMIACVSPAEYNAAETVNTLKYANRARNIKNRAVIAEKEEGWEDMEWLQGQIIRLRKELKGLKDGGSAGGAVLAASGSLDSNVTATTNGTGEGASRRVREQLTALQTTYEDLRGKYTQRTEELTRLRRELAERPAQEEEVNETGRYEELVGPVIEEYEKTISAMEAELSLNRAALRHTNDLVEEKEDELTAAAERHASAELYIEELKARVAKLGEREASTEAYVHDLEEKVRRYDESSVSSSGSITDLKRELARFRDADARSVQYISDLEQRLARADESVLGLQKTVERLEHDVDRRRAEAEALQARLAALTKDSESWRTDLEERERRVQELEQRLKEWERVRTEAGEERARLGIIVNGVEKEKQGLAASPPTSPSVSVTPVPALNGDGHSEPGTPVQRPALGLNTEVQLATLQETHAATLADLSSVSAKYRDALREISDLAAQIQEAKLNGSSAASDTSAPSGLSVEKVEAYAVQQARRRIGSDSPSRRLLFRHAASSESLHSRSVSQAVSLSQELSSVHGRKTSFSTNGSSSPMGSSPSRRPNLSLSLSSPTISNAQHDAQQRSISSMEKEIMRLQEVLKERETEIAVLETSLREAQPLPTSQNQQSTSLPALTPDVPGTPESPSSSGVLSPPDHLSPNTLRHFGEIRKAIHPADMETTSSISTVSEADENLERLNELMRSMAQKESAHREIVDDLTSQLAQVQRQHDDLSTLSRDQALNMSSELEGMRREHVDRLSQLEDLQKRELELMDVLKTANVEHDKAIAELQASHERALEAKGAEVDALIANLKAEHELALADAQAKLAASASALEAAHAEHEQAFGKLKAEHEEAQRQRAAEVEELLSRTREEHAAALAAAAAEHEASLKRKEEEHQETLAKNEEDYYNALMRLRDSHAQMLEKQAADAAASLARSREEHESALRMADLAREASLSESQSGHLSVLQEMQNEQANAAAAKEAAWQDELQRIRDSHERIQEAKAGEHQDALNRLRSEHAAALSKAQAEALKQVDDLKAVHALSQQEASAASSRAQQEADQTLRTVQEQQAAVLQEIERGHGEELASVKASHSESLEKATSKAAELEQSLQQATEETVKLKADHQQAIAAVNARLVAVQEEHLKDITSSREQSEAHANAEKERLQRLLAEMEASHTQERETLRKSHDLLASELASYKASAEQYLTERDALREERNKLSEQVAVMRARLDAHNTEQDSTLATHNTIAQELSVQTSLAQKHAAERDELQQGLDAVIAESASFKTQFDARSAELEQLRVTHSDLLEELAAHQAAADEYQASQQAMRSAHETAIAEHSAMVASVSAELDTVRSSSSALEAQLAALKAELESTHKAQVTLQHSASSKDKLATELEKQHTALAEMQDELQRTRDALAKEKAKSEAAAREFEARIARTPSPEQSSQPHASISARARMTSLPPAKLPPSVPMPAPPVPTEGTIASSVASTNSILSQASSAAETSTTTGTSISASVTERTMTVQDPKLLAQVAAQTQHIEEQDAMIKTLNKQLTHCESDLQAHMDLVSTLETSLGDCEKNLRKARMQATELARERDSLNGQVEGLRRQVTDSQRQVENVRQSIVEEKQSLESRLDEERRAKERARAQLDARMTEITKRKSKFACL